MNGPRLRYILGGAVLGALLGAVYANYLYVQYGEENNVSESVSNSNHTVIDAGEPVRATKVARKVTQEEKSESE